MKPKTDASASVATEKAYDIERGDDNPQNGSRQNQRAKTAKPRPSQDAHLLTEAEQSADKLSLISEVRRWRSDSDEAGGFESESISELAKSLMKLPEKFQRTAFSALEKLFARDAAERREKTLQVEVINILTDADVPVSKKFFRVVQAVGELVPFQYFSVNQILPIFEKSQPRHEDENLYSWERDARGDYQICSFDKFIKTIGSQSKKFTEMLEQISDAPYYNEPQFYAGAAFENLSRCYDLIGAIRRGFGFQSGIYLPVEVPNRGKILLVLNSTDPDGLTKQHFEMLVRLLPHFQVGLEKYLRL